MSNQFIVLYIPLLLSLLLIGCSSAELRNETLPERFLEGPAEPLLVAQVRASAQPLTGIEADYAPLIALIGEARVVLLGESTHGTHEFYQARSQITQRLIEEKGFDAVAVEANWPEALSVNHYVHGNHEVDTAHQALAQFNDFPHWMWRNTDVLEFTQWQRQYNQTLPNADRTGFYGIDLQTFSQASEIVVDFLDDVDPEAAARAVMRYECLAPYREDPTTYIRAISSGEAESCAAAVTEQVQELEEWVENGRVEGEPEAVFAALQSARMLARAEQYFRSATLRNVSTWNLRDEYMADVVDALLTHLSNDPDDPAKIVIWAHNSHVGDARATDRVRFNEVNLGQLARERWGAETVLVGFTTYTGTVMAASDWGMSPAIMQILPAQPESYASIFHQTEVPSFLLPLRLKPISFLFLWPRPQRAIGVVYQPAMELLSHYFDASLGVQFDAVIHFDESSAVVPLEPEILAGSP